MNAAPEVNATKLQGRVVSSSQPSNNDRLTWDASMHKWTPQPSTAAATFDGAFSSLSGKPTTLSGYGITDAEPVWVSIVALEDIPAFAVATIKGNRANSANTAHIHQVLGVTTAAINTGFSGNVVTDELVTNGAWSWSPGASIFLNGISLSQTPASTGFSQVVAVAKTSDTIFVSLSDPILL